MIEVAAFQDQSPPDGATLVLVDPPYGLGKAYAGVTEQVPYADWVIALLSWWAQSDCPRIMLLAPTPNIHAWMRDVPEPDEMVWWHRTFLMSGRAVKFWAPSLTPILVYQVADAPWYGPRRRHHEWHDVIDCVNMMGDVTALRGAFPNGRTVKHPGASGTHIASRLIAPTTAAGDLVVDPMAGFGSILVAAQRLGRATRGIEIEASYAEVAETWLDYERKRARA